MFGRALHVTEEGREFRFNSIPVRVPKNEYVAVRSILSIRSCIDLYVYYVVVGFSDRWESFEMLDWKLIFTTWRCLLKVVDRMVCRVLLGGFGVDECSGCNGLVMVNGKDELLLNDPG